MKLSLPDSSIQGIAQLVTFPDSNEYAEIRTLLRLACVSSNMYIPVQRSDTK